MSANMEAAAISRLREWKEVQMAGIKQREEALVAQLRAVVPESFNTWLNEDGESVIANLLKYGAASRKYRRGKDEGRPYGYTDLEEFERRFNELKAAWNGVANIKISWDGDYRFEVNFTVV